MILTGNEIQKNIGKDIIIDPFDPAAINPNSYNLKLHNELMVYENEQLDMKIPNPIKTIPIPEDGLVLEPNRLYLGRTMEYTETHSLVPMLEGRSSIGRLGMTVHITAGFGDIGFCGYWTLEIFVINPIKIYPYVSVCQIFYHTPTGDITKYQSSKYQKNSGVQASLLYKDFINDSP